MIVSHKTGPKNTDFKTGFKPVSTDRKHRSAILGVVIIIVSVGTFLIRSLQPLFTGHLMKRENPVKVLSVAEIVLTLVFLSIIPVVFYVFALGRRTINSESFPPPGAKIARDTQLLKEHRASIRGQMMVFIAVLLIVLALIGWMFTHFAVQSLSGK